MIDLSVQIEIARGLSWPRWKRLVSEVDRLGYRGLYICDHFFPPGQGYADSVEIMLAFTYLADHSARLEFGSLVSPVSFRDPVWLARDALALDNLSDGRMVLGVGAGWMEREHAAWGWELGDIPTRMARFEEAMEVLALLCRRNEPVSFDGRFYHLRDALLLPRSPRPNGPRFMVGGSGPKRTLPLAARYADVWNTGPSTPESFREKSTQLDEHVAKAGRPLSDVKRTLMIPIICYRTESDLIPQVTIESGQSPLDALAAQRSRSPNLISGTPAEVVDRLGDYAAAGVQEIMIQRFNLDDVETLQIIAEEVLPKVR
jgi:alkanesulfonate monooxygenase SsuD/methylene tetrahydromethanopterin reductase-like flavin-dependent oxidoreductase (luciferase family)